MDRNDIYRTNLHELDLAGLSELCANVALNHSANHTQTDTAHALHVEWVRIGIDHPPGDHRKEAEASLKKRMLEFLSGVPAWMMSGI